MDQLTKLTVAMDDQGDHDLDLCDPGLEERLAYEGVEVQIISSSGSSEKSAIVADVIVKPLQKRFSPVKIEPKDTNEDDLPEYVEIDDDYDIKWKDRKGTPEMDMEFIEINDSGIGADETGEGCDIEKSGLIDLTTDSPNIDKESSLDNQTVSDGGKVDTFKSERLDPYVDDDEMDGANAGIVELDYNDDSDDCIDDNNVDDDDDAMEHDQSQDDDSDDTERRSWKSERKKLKQHLHPYSGQMIGRGKQSVKGNTKIKSSIKEKKIKQENDPVTRTMTDIEQQIDKLNKEGDGLHVQIDNLSKSISAKDKELQMLNDMDSKKRLENLRQKDKDSYEAVIWLRGSKGLFTGTMYEPIALCVNVKDQFYARCLESLVSSNDMTKFFFEKHEDKNLFLEITRVEFNWTVEAETVPEYAPDWIKFRRPITDYREPTLLIKSEDEQRKQELKQQLKSEVDKKTELESECELINRRSQELARTLEELKQEKEESLVPPINSRLPKVTDVHAQTTTPATVTPLKEPPPPMDCEACGSTRSHNSIVQCCDGHVLCTSCVEKEAKLVIIGTKKGSVSCSVPSCDSSIPQSELRKSLPSIVMDLLEESWQKETLEALANMKDGVKCPGCGYSGVLEADIKNFKCNKCHKTFCRLCETEWHLKKHDLCIKMIKKVSEITGHSISIPAHWEIDTEKEKDMGFSVADLDPISVEYLDIAALFRKSIKCEALSVKKVYRIQNQRLWEKYSLCKNHMIQDMGELHINEKRLFHGTRIDVIDSICKEGFDWRLCGQNGTVFGQGTYFAKESSYSLRYSAVQLGKWTPTLGKRQPGDATTPTHFPPAYTRFMKFNVLTGQPPPQPHSAASSNVSTASSGSQGNFPLKYMSYYPGTSLSGGASTSTSNIGTSTASSSNVNTSSGANSNNINNTTSTAKGSNVNSGSGKSNLLFDPNVDLFDIYTRTSKNPIVRCNYGNGNPLTSNGNSTFGGVKPVSRIGGCFGGGKPSSTTNTNQSSGGGDPSSRTGSGFNFGGGNSSTMTNTNQHSVGGNPSGGFNIGGGNPSTTTNTNQGSLGGNLSGITGGGFNSYGGNLAKKIKTEHQTSNVTNNSVNHSLPRNGQTSTTNSALNVGAPPVITANSGSSTNPPVISLATKRKVNVPSGALPNNLFSISPMTQAERLKRIQEFREQQARLLQSFNSKVSSNSSTFGLTASTSSANVSTSSANVSTSTNLPSSSTSAPTTNPKLFVKRGVTISAFGDGCYYMFIGRVLVGKKCLGKSQMRRPGTDAQGQACHTAVNDLNNPSIYVVFDSGQCYPEYLIEISKDLRARP